MTIPCPQCGKPIQARSDGRLPPWCASCGADIKPGTPSGVDTSASHSTSTDQSASHSAANQNGAIPYFRGRRISSFGIDLYRVYVTDKDLLFLYAGNEGEKPQPCAPPMNALAGLAVGWRKWQESKDAQIAQRVQELNETDEATLRDYAKDTKDCFSAAKEDMKWLVIESP